MCLMRTFGIGEEYEWGFLDTSTNAHNGTDTTTKMTGPPLQVVGFDMVDDESKPERRPTKHSPVPSEWNSKHNCAYRCVCVCEEVQLAEEVLELCKGLVTVNSASHGSHAMKGCEERIIGYLSHPYR